jgi:hypothetical protein
MQNPPLLERIFPGAVPRTNMMHNALKMRLGEQG